MRVNGLKIAQEAFEVDWSSSFRENCQNVVNSATISKSSAQIFTQQRKTLGKP